MPRVKGSLNKIKEIEDDKYAMDIYDPLTKDLLRTEYYKSINDISNALNLGCNTVRFIIQGRNKKLCNIYNIYHVDKDKNRLDDLWKWKNHK